MERLDRCAAYVAARDALAALHRAAPTWPASLADPARDAATRAVVATAESIAYAHASAGRRRLARDALEAALQLAAACDVARALGHHDDAAQRESSRSIATLGLFLHANTVVWDDD